MSSQVLGELYSGLYAVDDNRSKLDYLPQNGTACPASLEEAKLWHMRLGHMSFNKLHLVHDCF